MSAEPQTNPPGTPRPRSLGPWIIGTFVVSAALILAGFGWAWVNRPRDHWGEVARARAYVERGRPDLAYQIVSPIDDTAPGAAEALSLAGQLLYGSEEIASARKSLERALELNPEQTDAACILAHIYAGYGDAPHALAVLESAKRYAPEDFRPWYWLGKVHHDQGEYTKSVEELTQALRLAKSPPETRECRIGRAVALLDSKHAKEADADLVELRKEAPDDPSILLLAARAARELGRDAEAIELADRVLAAESTNLDALLIRARTRLAKGEAQAALPDLERILRTNSSHLDALESFADAQTKLGKDAGAAATRELLRKARERQALIDRLTGELVKKPKDATLRWRLGQACLEAGKITQAYRYFQAALDFDPEYGPAQEALNHLKAKYPKGPPDAPQRPAQPNPR